MELVEERPNVELRRGPDGRSIVVLAFPYDPHIVARRARASRSRRFDWDTREWWAPVDDWAGVHVADVLDRFPELTHQREVDAWLRGHRAPLGRARDDRRATTAAAGGSLRHARGHGARGAARGRGRARGRRAAGAAHRARAPRRCAELRAARASTAPRARCIAVAGARRGPAARAAGRAARRVDGEPSCASRCSGTPTSASAFERAARAPTDRAARCRSTRGSSSTLDAFLALHDVAVDGAGRARRSRTLRAEHDEAPSAIRRSRATSGEPIAEVAARARRRAAAVPVGRRALRARRAARLPGRRAGPRQDRRGARGAGGRRRLSRRSSSARPR